jgi:hypothetical protein
MSRSYTCSPSGAFIACSGIFSFTIRCASILWIEYMYSSKQVSLRAKIKQINITKHTHKWYLIRPNVLVVCLKAVKHSLNVFIERFCINHVEELFRMKDFSSPETQYCPIQIVDSVCTQSFDCGVLELRFAERSHWNSLIGRVTSHETEDKYDEDYTYET